MKSNQNLQIKRVYHPYYKWEEVAFNMWGEVSGKKEWIHKAIIFTGNHKLYGSFMEKVTHEWPISCENALTDKALNKRAWIGHAACALYMGCPEYIVREAWGRLTDEQRLLANKEATRAIQLWTLAYTENRRIYSSMGKPML